MRLQIRVKSKCLTKLNLNNKNGYLFAIIDKYDSNNDGRHFGLFSLDLPSVTKEPEARWHLSPLLPIQMSQGLNMGQ